MIRGQEKSFKQQSYPNRTRSMVKGSVVVSLPSPKLLLSESEGHKNGKLIFVKLHTNLFALYLIYEGKDFFEHKNLTFYEEKYLKNLDNLD